MATNEAGVVVDATIAQEETEVAPSLLDFVALRIPCLRSLQVPCDSVCHCCMTIAYGGVVCVACAVAFGIIGLYITALVFASVGLPDQICALASMALIFSVLLTSNVFIWSYMYNSAQNSGRDNFRQVGKRLYARWSIGLVVFFFVHFAALLHGVVWVGYCPPLQSLAPVALASATFAFLGSVAFAIRYCGYLPWYARLTEEDAESADFGMWVGVPWMGKVVSTDGANAVFFLAFLGSIAAGVGTGLLQIALGSSSPLFDWCGTGKAGAVGVTFFNAFVFIAFALDRLLSAENTENVVVEFRFLIAYVFLCIGAMASGLAQGLHLATDACPNNGDHYIAYACFGVSTGVLLLYALYLRFVLLPFLRWRAQTTASANPMTGVRSVMTILQPEPNAV